MKKISLKKGQMRAIKAKTGSSSKSEICTWLYQSVSLSIICRIACQLKNGITHHNLMKTDIVMKIANLWLIY
jgi:hypothetical protein